MNNFSSLNLCSKCVMEAIPDEKRCANCKSQWNNDALPKEFSPLSVQDQLLKERRDSLTVQKRCAKEARIVGRIALLLACAAVIMLYMSLSSFLGSFNQFATEASGLVTKISELTNTLNSIDLNGLAETSKEVLQQSNASIEAALERIALIDIEGLNSSIQGLAKIVTPLAGLFGR